MKKTRSFETLLALSVAFSKWPESEPIVLEAPPRVDELPFQITYPEDPRGCRGSAFIPSKTSKKWSRRG